MRVPRVGLLVAGAVIATGACSGQSAGVLGAQPSPAFTTPPASSVTSSPAEHRRHPTRRVGRTPSPAPTVPTSQAPVPASSPDVTRTTRPPAGSTTPAPKRTSAHPSRTPSPTPTRTTTPPCAATGSTATIDIVDQASATAPWQFSPRTLDIACGDAVTVTNDTTASHTWSPTHGGFSGSGNMAAAASYTYTFRYAGTFAFVCAYHSWMTGTVRVT